MVDAIIPGAIIVLLIAGFWWTRGAGGMPGGVEDPAQQDFSASRSSATRCRK